MSLRLSYIEKPLAAGAGQKHFKWLRLVRIAVTDPGGGHKRDVHANLFRLFLLEPGVGSCIARSREQEPESDRTIEREREREQQKKKQGVGFGSGLID